MRRIIQKVVLISLPTLVVSLLVLEVGLRLFVPVSDVKPQNIFNDETGILIKEPNYEGTLITPAFASRFHINAQGWNAPQDYVAEKPAGTFRIAVIGDSYVEAYQADVDKNFGMIVEEFLGEAADTPVEVYMFGISGAPLSQYLHVMRHVAETYAPDLYIINIVHNDFEESIVDLRSTPFFMQYQLVADGDIEEVSPVPNQRSTAQRLFRLIAPSALARYLAYNLNLLDRFVAVANPTVVSFEALEVDRPLVETVTAYSLQEYGAVAQRAGGRLLVVIDADRRQLYGETVSSGIDYQIYNNIVEAVTNDLKIPLLDLTTPFTSDYEMNHIQFESEKDYHWNEYGHNLVGKTIVNFLLDNQWLD